ncbi:MAG: orotate phosphoribosyltransferase [Deltaproteobacteria bacterium]|nr:orotate phosphoribosyltransferase [Deltaproteobacteria bacterium]
MDYKREFLDLLLQKNAFKIATDVGSFFKLKSGRMSPTFASIGALTDGESLAMMKKAYSQAAMDGVRGGVLKDFQYVFGPAYKGINLCALTCEGLYEQFGKNTSYLYDRKEEKAYGEATQGTDASKVIVGAEKFQPGGGILLVDDVITTGQAKYEALDKIKLLGDYTIAGMVIAVDRQESLSDAAGSISAVQVLEKELGIKTVAILTMHDIFTLRKDSLVPDVRRAWVAYYERYGAVRMQ